MASKVLVAGSGVIGLRTALELMRREGFSVVLRSKHGPLHTTTCSQGAGGLWMPFHCDDARVDGWVLETLDELHRFVGTPSASGESRPSPVEIVPAVMLFRDKHDPNEHSNVPAWTKDPRLGFQHLSVAQLCEQNAKMRLKLPPRRELNEAGYESAWLLHLPIVDPLKMLPAMLEEINEIGAQRNDPVDIDLEMGDAGCYESLEHMVEDAKRLGCDAVINCSSLGSREIADDKQLLPARGILHHYDRSNCLRRDGIAADELGALVNDATIMTEEAPWGSETRPAYMIARGDTIVVGGSYLEHDIRTTLSDEESEMLLSNANFLGIDTDRCKPSGEWVGLRPYRNPSRCEIDAKYNGRDDEGSDNSMRVVHSYGYGGSGWTVYSGVATEAANILSKSGS